MNILSKILRRDTAHHSVASSNVCRRSSGAHLKAAGDFQWDKAKASDIAFSYDDGDLSAFAVGRDNWTTIMAAMCAIYGFDGGGGFGFLEDAISERAWVQAKDQRIQSWLAANDKCFSTLPTLIYESQATIVPAEQRVGRFAHPRAVEYPPYRIANIYIAAWQRMHPPAMNDFLIICDGIGGDYWDHPDIEGAQQAAKRAFEVTRNLALEWFEVRGFEVDKTDHLVRLDGYQPLYMIHEIEI